MHVRTRKLAFAGLMLAVTIVCLYLGNIIESNTLFLLAGASYFVGIVYREAGAKMSLAFYVGALILGFLVTPNKFYILPVWMFAGVVAAGQIAFLLYDRAYEYVQGSLWNKIRNRW